MNKTAVASARHCSSGPTIDLDKTTSYHSSLLQRLSANNAEGIRSLLATNRDVSIALAALHSSAYAALLNAAEQGKSDALYAVLEKLPADVLGIRRACDGRTLMMLAAQNGHARIVVNHHRVMREKSRALSLVSEHALFSYRPTIGKGYGNSTPLGDDFDSQWLDSVNAKDKDGNTPLLLAVKNCHYLCARILLMFRADVHLENLSGQSAFSVASGLCNQPEIRELVLAV